MFGLKIVGETKDTNWIMHFFIHFEVAKNFVNPGFVYF